MKEQKKTKIAVGIGIALMLIIAIFAVVYSNNNSRYVVDVVKASANSEDDNLRVTESIIMPQGQSYYDSRNLDYQVQLNNKQGANRQIQVALAVDTSYSMEVNDEQSIVKQEAVNLATSLLNNVEGVRISVTGNSGLKQGMTNNRTYIVNAINGLAQEEIQDCSNGLQAAYNSFGTASNGYTLSKILIYFTDSTDNITDKMQSIMEQDPELKVISVLIDMTSSSYLNLNNGRPVEYTLTNGDVVSGEVYVLASNVDENDILPANVNLYSIEAINDEINLVAKNIKVTNYFSDAVVNYFDITIPDQDGVTILYNNANKVCGYEWNVEKIKFGKSTKMNFSIQLKSISQMDASHLFRNLSTNKTQNIEYYLNDSSTKLTFNGNDERVQVNETQGDESTLIKICQGYTLKVKAVSESNRELIVSGVTLNVRAEKVLGVDDLGEYTVDTQNPLLNKQYTVDRDGYITVTAEDTGALRSDGQIKYTITPVNSGSLVGYENSESIYFVIDNNGITTNLSVDKMGAELKPENPINETTRTIEMEIPISTAKFDLEIRAQELNNSNVTLSDCEFELIQPKLNNKYEMSVLAGKTDSNGVLHLYPTVMTKGGTYNYILRQVNAPSTHDVTPLTMITITFDANGNIVPESGNVIKTMYNEHVKGVYDNTPNLARDHVIITVEDICVETDPFDLQINLKDLETGDLVEGVTYLVQTTNSLNQVRKEYVTTDANGQINTKVYGTGNVIITITEQSTKAGYQEDTNVKEILVNRVDGNITITYANPQQIHNTDQYKTKVMKNENAETIGVMVNLGTHKKFEQNIVRLLLVEAEETDVNVGTGIVYDLYDDEGNSYGPVISDLKGIVKFTVGNRPQGVYQYKLVLDKSSVPSCYDQNKLDEEIFVNLEFDANEFITSANSQVQTQGQSILEEGYKLINTDTSLEHAYEIKIGYFYNDSNTFKFVVDLKDEDTNAPIEGAYYNIDINWEIYENGQTIERTKTITKRATAGNGQLSTVLLKADNMTINVTEVEPKSGYKNDFTTQEIHLIKNNNNEMRIDYQNPYDLGATNQDHPNNGAEMIPAQYQGGQLVQGTGQLVYHHKNKARSLEDTYVNLSIRKIDPNGMYVNGIKLKVESEDLLDGNNAQLKDIIETGSQAPNMDGEVIYNYNDFVNAVPNSYTIRVPGLSAKQENEDVVYEMNLTEMKVDPQAPNGLSEKTSTTVKLRLIFRNTEGVIRLTNVETIYGNRLVIRKEFSSSADTTDGQQLQDQLGIFLANIQLDLYTNYDDVGNLSLDFKKLNLLNDELTGAEYDIRIVNPDGTVIKKHTVIDNGQDSDAIELKGVTVYEESKIYITETNAPIGYGINSNTETINVASVSELGFVELEVEDSSYNPARTIITALQPTDLSDGKVKENYEVDLIDYQLDIFEIEVDAVDNQTLSLVQGFDFNVQTSAGAQGTLTSGVMDKIGGNPSDTTVKYTITPTQTAQYYRKMTTPFDVYVVFDASGNVDVDATLNGQTDPGYGTLWEITNLNATAEGQLKIQLKVTHLDELTVKVVTKDAFNNNVINDVTYQIESLITSTGSNNLKVAYMSENGMHSYVLKQTQIRDGYKLINDLPFNVTYSNAVVTSATLQLDNSFVYQPTIAVTGNSEITITVIVEPKVPFEISNEAFFDGTTKLQGANFEITEIESNEVSTGTTDANGIAGIYNSTFVENTSKMYKVSQTKASTGFATVEDFYVKVTFDANKDITTAELVDLNQTPVTNNRFVTVGLAQTSSYSQYTNNNTKGIVTINVKNYPEFKINITDVDRRDGTTPVVGTEYSVSSYYINSNNDQVAFTSTNNVVTDQNGLGIAHLDKTKDGTVVTYVIKEDSPAIGYQSIGTDIEIEVSYDNDGYVTNAQLKDAQLSNIANVTLKNPINSNEDRFEINVELKNNPILQIRMTTTDRDNPAMRLKDVGYQVIAKLEEVVVSNSSNVNKVNQTENPETCYSDADGLAIAYMDRTIENKIVKYRIE